MKALQSFDEWWEELCALAKRKCVPWLLCAQADHKDAWEDGLSPAEELEAQADEARRLE